MIGICTPLSFLKSNGSQGIGDLEDLKLLIDWCQQQQIRLIQLLPISDTGLESSPYAAISSIALNPVYLRLPKTTPFLNYLNGEDRVCYPSIYKQKMDALSVMEFPEVSPDFLKKWPSMLEYGVYKALKEDHNYHSHQSFYPKNLCVEEILDQKDAGFKKRVDQHIRIQQHLFKEWKKIKDYADAAKVFLMGDLPILVSKESHEVYFHPNLFDLKYEAGAPPDAFAADGQNWGQPIYNWKEHEKEHFRFFRQRVSVLEQFFDYYRIDHTIGFFRFWQIPNSKKGSEGFFSSCDPEEYLPQAKKRLKALLQHTRIKPIAEDLGTKPFGMEKTLEELHIPGMKVLRWEEDPDVFPIQSLSTVSLHDTTLMASWFRQENGRGIQDDERVALLKTSLKAPSIFKVNLLQEYLALEERYRYAFDEMEQINIPSTVLPTNWSIRMKGSLEDLKENRHLALKIKTLIDSGYDQ